jgi:hypothetical protein
MAERRWRVWINICVFVLATALILVLSMAQRDHQSVQTCFERMDYIRQQLEGLLGKGEVAPRHLPLPEVEPPPSDASLDERERYEEEVLSRREHYFYNTRYGAAAATPDAPTGVCCCKAPHRLYLREDGRHVIIFDGEQYELIWLTESEFRRREKALGFDLPTAP